MRQDIAPCTQRTRCCLNQRSSRHVYFRAYRIFHLASFSQRTSALLLQKKGPPRCLSRNANLDRKPGFAVFCPDLEDQSSPRSLEMTIK